MTGRQLRVVAAAAALVLLVPLAVYLPWLLVGGVLAVWAGGSLRRRLCGTPTEKRSHA